MKIIINGHELNASNVYEHVTRGKLVASNTVDVFPDFSFLQGVTLLDSLEVKNDDGTAVVLDGDYNFLHDLYKDYSIIGKTYKITLTHVEVENETNSN